MRKHLPGPEHFLNLTLPFLPNHKVVEHIGSGANGRVYRAHAANIDGDLALKFVPTENLPTDPLQRDLYLAEAKKANSLENSCVVPCIDVRPWEDASLNRTFVVFICQYVSGPSLNKFIRENRTDIGISFIERFLSTMFSLLFELDLRGMVHGDLHGGNVLVSRSRFDLNREITFRVTDFGIAEITEIAHSSDYLSIAQILKDLLECINYQEQQPRDRYVFEVLRRDFLGRHLIEADPIADPLAINPQKLQQKLDSVDEAFFNANREHTSTQMVSPFDYPNCEQMGNAHLLLRNLYSDRLLGLSEIKALSNLVLTGPRGCGKTTVFRALSLDYLMSVDADHPSNLQFMGIYYRCDDLYFSFPRYELPNRGEAFDIPIHFIICSLMAETLQNVGRWAKSHFPDEFEKKEPGVTRKLREILGLQQSAQAAFDRFPPLVSHLSKQRARAAKKQRFCNVPEEPIDGYVGPNALLQCCAELRSAFSFLRDRPFFYFIDDYSTPKITEALQRNLNRLFMHRHADVFFKLSTESPISFERQDIDEKQYVEQREYELLNLGLRYLQHGGHQVHTFLGDLFSRRFREVKTFPCKSLSELLGDNPRNENEAARQLRQKKGQSTFHGVQTVTAMCSGDIHYMIRLVGKMVEDAGGSDFIGSHVEAPRISIRRQSDTIRLAAGEFMESVRTLPRRGDELAAIVSAIGNVARSYMQYRNAGNETGNPPHQASRIEPYEPLDLSANAQELLNDLIRFSILLIDPRGKSRRGAVVPRFYLRRYLIPHFNLTFSKRDSLELENREIEFLLTDPQKFQEAKRLRKNYTAKNQGYLFDE